MTSGINPNIGVSITRCDGNQGRAILEKNKGVVVEIIF